MNRLALFLVLVLAVSQTAAGATEEATSWRAGVIFPYRNACETEDAMLAVAMNGQGLFERFKKEGKCYTLVYKIRAVLVEYIDGPFPFDLNGRVVYGSVWRALDVPPYEPEEAFIFLDDHRGPFPVIIDPPRQPQSY